MLNLPQGDRKVLEGKKQRLGANLRLKAGSGRSIPVSLISVLSPSDSTYLF
jgi:hypothetical protein